MIEDRSVIRRLLSLFSRRRRQQFLFIFFLTIFGSLAELVSIGAVIPFLQIIAAPQTIEKLPLIPAIMRNYGINSASELIVPAALFLIAAAVAAAAIRIALVWATNRFVYGLTHDLSMLAYDRVIRQPYSLYIQRNSAEILSGMEKIHYIGAYLLSPVMNGLSSALIALGIIAVLMMINPFVALVAGGSIGAVYLIIGYLSRVYLIKFGRLQAKYSTERVKLAQESLGGIRDIILDRAYATFSWQYRVVDSLLRRVTSSIGFLTAMPRFAVEAAGMILIAVFALYFAGQPGGVLAAIPVLGALALGAQRLMPLAQNINLGFMQYSSMQGTVQDVLSLVEADVISTSTELSHNEIVPFEDHILFDNVEFRYDDGTVALSEITLDISRGMRVGVIGRTGSGKSTLLDILMGLLVPTSGTLSVDGRTLAEAEVVNWQAQVAHVPQSIFLVDDTIAVNIAFGAAGSEIDMQRVRDAAKRADAAEFVEQLADGYDTRVGERGVRLSGGQRQRLGIARALYKRATVLILDEATSALDDNTELAVMNGIERLDRSLTIFTIAHRLTTLRNCDLVIRLDGGRITQSGSYQDVVQSGSRNKDA